MDKPIELHNTPQFYVEYVKNWLMHSKKEKRSAAEIVIVQDICTLVELAAANLSPVPTNKESQSN